MDYDKIIALIHAEVKPALGCTEPIAVALAVARAAEALRDGCGLEPAEISAGVSPNILKNGMGVGIPGTGMVGLHVAAALGAVCGCSRYGLEVLHELCPKAVEKARKLVKTGKVVISLAPTDEMLYVYAEARAEGHVASAVISGAHDRIVEATFDGASVLAAGTPAGEAASGSADCVEPDFARRITVRDIWEFVNTVPLEKIAFMEDSVTMNRALAEEGLRHPYGLQVGRTLLADDNKSVYGDTLLIHAMAWTAAASDARMAGCTLSAMSNSGSGNQGVTATMPVIAIAEKTGASHEELLRALALSHLVAIHIKGYLGKLSALCGCVIASTGSACGIVYLRKGGYEQVCAAIKNMIGNITGMVCDGAKVGCALKVASGVATALQSAVLALDGQCISASDGIIEEEIEKTIANLGRIGSVGMKATDKMILDIMSCK
ncbi:MAG: serine dehydratase subunit alpha family protein [Bacteroidales bacterium]|nr:serine dehydratase subunit alpha family protein [Bacteroidales bacterium]